MIGSKVLDQSFLTHMTQKKLTVSWVQTTPDMEQYITAEISMHQCTAQYVVSLTQSYVIAIYSTVVKYTLFHEKTRDILFFERPQGARKIKFREFSREIKGFITVEYVVLFNEADGQDTF